MSLSEMLENSQIKKTYLNVQLIAFNVCKLIVCHLCGNNEHVYPSNKMTALVRSVNSRFNVAVNIMRHL